MAIMEKCAQTETVRDIIEKYLSDNGYDGLCNYGCSCETKDLSHCLVMNGPCLECMPGRVTQCWRCTKRSSCKDASDRRRVVLDGFCEPKYERERKWELDAKDIEVGDLVAYLPESEGKIYKCEIGVVKEVRKKNGVAFVAYGLGDTSACTPMSLLRKIDNEFAVLGLVQRMEQLGRKMSGLTDGCESWGLK